MLAPMQELMRETCADYTGMLNFDEAWMLRVLLCARGAMIVIGVQFSLCTFLAHSDACCPGELSTL